MTRIRPKRGRGTLHVIAGLLIASAALRLTMAATPLQAENTVDVATAASPAAPTVATTADGDIDALLQAFQQREERLIQREHALADRLQALRVAEQEVSEKLAALTEAEAALRATLALADSAAESDLGRLATVYENMKPKDAAALFTEMPPEFAAGFLGLMLPEAAAAIMTELEAPVAYSISVMLAGRNAGVPTQ